SRTLWIILEGPIHVLANVKVRKTIAVQVGPTGTSAPELFGQTGFFGHVDEPPASLTVRLILIQHDAAPAGYQKVRPAIAVVVRVRAAMRIKKWSVQSNLRRHVPKLTIAEVFEEPAGIPLDLLFIGTIEVATARGEYVQQAIAVVIENGDSAAQRFQYRIVIRFLPIAISQIHTRRRGHVAIKIANYLCPRTVNQGFIRPFRQRAEVLRKGISVGLRRDAYSGRHVPPPAASRAIAQDRRE